MERRGDQSQSARGRSLSPKRAVTRAVIETLEGRVLLSGNPATLAPLMASPAVRALVSPAPSALWASAAPATRSSAPLTLPASGLDPEVLAVTVKAPGIKSTIPTTPLDSAVTILYVDASMSGGSHDGSSWANAYQELQQALGAATSGHSDSGRLRHLYAYQRH